MSRGAMAVHRVSYSTLPNQQNPVATINELIYNRVHKDWKELDIRDFTLPFNERADVFRFEKPDRIGSNGRDERLARSPERNPSSLNFLPSSFHRTFISLDLTQKVFEPIIFFIKKYSNRISERILRRDSL